MEFIFPSFYRNIVALSVDKLNNLKEDDPKIRALLEDPYSSDCEILSKITPYTWMDSLRTICSEGLQTYFHGRYEGPYEKTLIGYMLSNDWYGFPGYDIYVPLRLAMEAFPSGKHLIYDLTDIIAQEYFKFDEDFVEYGLALSATQYSSDAKTIILTEGKSDAWILRESLNLLYPHLADYFSFLDFESTNFGGGVGNLANVVKAFAGAGIANNVVALFDNDTAATVVCKALEQVSFPPNISIRQLPRIAFLNYYPTIGPSGAVNLDVNGIAASIELYLGQDVLKLDGVNFTPVQWTGYDKSINKYQGEILEKTKVQNNFREKISNKLNLAGAEWDDLRAIFKVIFSAFEKRNREAIYCRPDEYYAA